MDSQYIKKVLSGLSRSRSVFIPEFTWGASRIDAIIIDFEHRWIRGFEIKTNKSDFLYDDKYALYSRFLSSLSIVCPENLIDPSEIGKPFGLIWIKEFAEKQIIWKKKPSNFQKRNSLAWLWTYVKVLELEFPRMEIEKNRLEREIKIMSRLTLKPRFNK